MDNINKDCISCYGTGIHVHVYSSGPFGIEPMWGGCVKCNPEGDNENSFPQHFHGSDISRHFLAPIEIQEYYWVKITPDTLEVCPWQIEIVAGIWSSSEAAETALKKFSEKPNWEYEDKTIIVLNRDCLRTLVNCNEFSYKD